ncbi:MFS transporter [Streptomyces caeni]|uniref:MFS transporter n=2 Tax=Streptomyces caeni TaxID=2307231 RepID=A0ABW4IZ40_9ACTN
MISYADRFGFIPLVAAAATGLRAALSDVATAVSIYFLLYGAAQPIIGILSDRRGRVRVLRWALATLAVSDLAAALAPGSVSLIATRAVAGAASGALLPTTLVYLGDTVDFRFRQRAVARVLAAAALAAAAAMAASGLLAQWVGWRAPLLLVAVPAAVLSIQLRDLAEPPRSAERTSLLQVLRSSPATRALMVFALAEGAAMLGFFPFLAPMLESRGSSTAVAGTVVGVYGIATVAGSRLLGTMPARLAPRLPLIAGGLAMVVGYLIISLSQGIAPVLATAALLGFSFSLFHSTFQTWATQLLPNARGVVTSLFVSAVFTGAALASLWGGGLESRHAYHELFAIATALAGAVGIIGTIARLRHPSTAVNPGAASPHGGSTAPSRH